MKRMGIIYCLHCISTGEKYVGQTKRSFDDRLRYHRYDAEKSKNKKSAKAKLYIQVNKTGWEDFICGIIEEFDVESLDEKECFYIKKYDTINSGLNTAPGGGFFPSFSGENHPLYGIGHSEETKRKISKNHHNVSGKNNPMFGKIFTDDHKQKIRSKLIEISHCVGTFWWNNGVAQVRSKDKPGDNFVKGRLPITKSIKPSIHKNTFWWNNGQIEVRSKEIPGENFIRGRLSKSKTLK